MSEDNKAWLILANAYVRATELAMLTERFGSVIEITRQSSSALEAAGLAADKSKAVASPAAELVDTGLEWLDDPQHHIVACTDAALPELLQQISAPPLLLYVNGNTDETPRN